MLHRLLHFTWLTLAAVLLLTAIALTAARLWAPALAEYRDDIAHEASAVLGRKLSIGRLEASWRGLQPVLELHDVTIFNETDDTASLYIEQVRVRPDMAHFLRNRTVQISGIDIIGTELVLSRNCDGEFELEGFAGGDGDLSALSAMTRLSLLQSRLVLHDAIRDGSSQRLSMLDLVLTNDGDTHKLAGHAYLPDDIGYRVELNGSFAGKNIDPRSWAGRLYVEGQKLSLPLIAGQLMAENPLSSGIADLRLWLDVSAGKLDSMTAELELKELVVEHEDGARLVQLDAGGLRGGWKRHDDGWQGQISLLSASFYGQAWTPLTVSILHDRAGLRQYTRLITDRLVLDELHALLPLHRLFPDDGAAAYASLQPSGELHNVEMLLLHPDDGLRLGGLRAELQNVAIEPAAGLPGLAGLDARLNASDDAGEIELASRSFEIVDDRLFRDALTFDELVGRLSWHITDEGIEISSREFKLSNNDLALNGSFSFTQPHEGSSSLDLSADIDYADVARVRHYLPAKIMSPKGVAWLDKSLVGGQALDGSVRISGRLDQMPYDNGEGVLEVRLPVSNATLDFNEDWSPVTDLDAQVDFTGRRMDIRSRRGKIRSADLHAVHAQILDLKHPHLTLDGEVRGALSVMLAELGSSPLGETYGGFVDRAITAGNSGLVLDIDVPLTGNGREITAAGRISLRDNTLKLKASDLYLSTITGELEFDGKGIRGDRLKTSLNGHAADVRVWSESQSGTPVTHILLDGRLGLLSQLLGDYYGPDQLVSGESSWQAQVSLRGTPARGKPANVGLRIESDLVGVNVNLPQPLGKTSDDKRPLKLVIENTEQSPQDVSIDWGDILSGRLQLSQKNKGAQVQRGVIMLGGGEAELPVDPGLLINGKLQNVQLSDWIALAGSGEGGPDTTIRMALEIDQLDMLGYRLDALELNMTRVGRQWRIDASGDKNRGHINLTPGNRGLDRIVMNMERLELQALQGNEDDEDEGIRYSPADIPSLQVNAKQLIYNGADFGQLDIKAVHEGDTRFIVERFALSSDLLAMRLSGEWSEAGGSPRSEIEVNIERGKMGRLLDVFGYEKTIKDGALYGTLTAAWPSAIWDFQPEVVDGRLQVIIKKGQLLELEPGAPGRVLGLLSLTRLPKRLTLDFSDLFGKGFGFDRIGGNFVLESGNAYTEDLVIDGSSAKIGITGRVGLGARDYDELVTVTPYLESSLPLAGAIVGGPAVGAAAMVAEKLLEGKLGINELARKQYTVTGSWEEPVVTELKSATRKNPSGDPSDHDTFDEDLYD